MMSLILITKTKEEIMGNLKSFREESKRDFITTGMPTIEQLQTGALCRIADAVEIMTKDRVKLENDLNWYRENYRNQLERIATLEKSRNTYKGKFNNLKKRLEESK